MNKQDLISKIKQLDGVTQDERSYLINLVNTKKKYGLVWEDKPEDVEEQLRDNLPVLKEVKDKAIINGKDNPNHILIEGDNLHALTALTFTHEGKIDVIYIDPPYNTGKKKEFRYNDNWIDENSPYRHSMWLSFMKKRLEIAKRLLSDDGIIFISIDDKEIAQLRLLCDEIFNEKKLAGIIHRRKNRKPHNAGNTMSLSYEFILSYYKNRTFKLCQEFSEMKSDEHGNFALYPIVKGDKKERIYFFQSGLRVDCNDFKKGIVKAGRNSNLDIEILDDPIVENNILQNNIRIKGRYCLTDERGLLTEAMNKKRIFFNDKGFPKEKRYRTEEDFKIDNHHWDIDKGKNEDGDDEIKEIFALTGDNEIFKYPKPTELIKKVLSTYPNNNLTILDFFAGSGTTLHATMSLNAEDGGNRQCILVTNNENNICEEVTYERNKRVIHGYTNAKGIVIDSLYNNNLRYFKSEYVNRNPTHKNKKELTHLATELLCIKEDCYTPITKTEKWYDAFSDYKSQFIVIYDDIMIEESISIIKKMYEAKQNSNPIKVYVFSNGQYPYTEDFEEVLPYITLCALPDAIYKAYQNVLPKKKKEIIPVLEDDILGEEENLFNQENE
jgi:adenine-specific DNA-methyltransferase